MKATRFKTEFLIFFSAFFRYQKQKQTGYLYTLKWSAVWSLRMAVMIICFHLSWWLAIWQAKMICRCKEREREVEELEQQLQAERLSRSTQEVQNCPEDEEQQQRDVREVLQGVLDDERRRSGNSELQVNSKNLNVLTWGKKEPMKSQKNYSPIRRISFRGLC